MYRRLQALITAVLLVVTYPVAAYREHANNRRHTDFRSRRGFCGVGPGA